MIMATKHTKATIVQAQKARRKHIGMMKLPFKARLIAYDTAANAPSNNGKVWGSLQQKQEQAKAEQKHWPIEYTFS